MVTSEFLPSGAIHHSKEDGVFAGLDANKVTSGGIVSDGGGGRAEEEAGAAALAGTLEVQRDRGGKIIGCLSVQEDFFAGAVVIDRLFGRGPEFETVGGDLQELGVAVVGVISAEV